MIQPASARQADSPPDMMESPPCNLCGADRAVLLFSAMDLQYQAVLPDVRCGVVRCESCGHVYLRPRVREEHINLFYSKSEYYTNRRSRGRLQSFSEAVEMAVGQTCLGYAESVQGPRLLRHASRILARLAYRLAPFRFRRILPYRPHGRVMDFGFGAGDFLLQMRRFGWECWGVEVNPARVQAMKEAGVSAFTALSDPRIPAAYFDWVTAYHSIEHVYDPGAVLQRLFQLLKPGGRLYVGVPNFAGLWPRIFRSRWYDLSTPIHPHMFTPETTTRYLSECGFTGIQVRHWSLSSAILGSLQNCVNSLLSIAFGRKFTGMWLRDSTALRIAVTPLVWLADILALGDRIEVIAMKPDASG